MDYMLEREKIAAAETVYDGCQEQPVDLDVNLPDYCPDIQRILKCQIYPKISSRSIAGDRLMLDGSYNVKIFYLAPEGNNVRFFETNDSYSVEIALKQQADNALIFASPRVEYVNCRASGPRRLNVHGSFSLCARVVTAGQDEAVSNIAGDDVEQLKTTANISEIAGFSQQQFSVDEVLELGKEKPAADSIVRVQAFAELQDCKVTAGKAMTKGEVYVKFLYLSTGETGSLETMEYSIPFTQMLDCDGVTEDCLCSVHFMVAGVETQIKSDYSGDSTYFDTQVKIHATVEAYRKTEVTFVNDAFSKLYDLNITAKQKTIESLSESASDTLVHRSEIGVEDHTVSKVIDVWSEMANAAASVESSKITMKGKYSLCVLAQDEKGLPFYFERLIDFEHQIPSSSTGDLKCTANVITGGISYRIVDKGLEVKTELHISAEVMQRITYKAITEVTADETKPVARDASTSLCLYYADAGESVWNIAREYRTSVEAVRTENGISGAVVENQGMLMIPM
jgi:hypothetical protein